MRKLILLLLLVTSNLYAQKEDYTWLIGGWDTGDTVKNILHFNEDGYSIDTFGNSSLQEIFITNASISDSLGELLFYSSGIAIYSANHEIVPNGDTINPGYVRDDWINFLGAYPLYNGMLMLKDVIKDDKYFAFHLRGDSLAFDTLVGGFGHVVELALTTVVLDDFGMPYVEEKNIPIISDTLTNGGVSACRHGNGRDWWIMVGEANNNCYYTLLMTPDSIQLVHRQCMGIKSHPIDGGQSLFSADGSKYIRGSVIDGVEIFDFDRCSGLLSNAVSIYHDAFNVAFSPNVSVSSNNEFLYHGYDSLFFQFDLNAQDVFNSRELLVNAGSPPYTYGFTNHRLGPDGRIYVGDIRPQWSVIHNPNEYGIACDLQVQVPLLKDCSTGLPNFPNYRLGCLVGSECDTLNCDSVDSVRDRLIEKNLKLFPNPTNSVVRIEYGNFLWNDSDELSLQITNLIGQEVLNVSLHQYSLFQDLNIETYEPGVYFMNLYLNGNLVGKRKLVVE